jgi:hypothetical protein
MFLGLTDPDKLVRSGSVLPFSHKCVEQTEIVSEQDFNTKF